MKLAAKKRLEYELLLNSLIGKQVTIIDSKNKNQIGKKGTLIRETHSTLILEEEGLEKQYLKTSLILQIDWEGKPLNIDGRLLFSTIINRIKKLK